MLIPPNGPISARTPFKVAVSLGMNIPPLNIMNTRKITSLCVHKKNNVHKTIGLIHIHHLLDSNIE